MNEVGRFIAKNPTVESWKLDGLTIVCRFEKGKYKQAITRGTNGLIGEDVTEAFKHCINLPLQLPMSVDLEVRGECVMSWSNFEKINEKLAVPFKHPRNLAAGSVRTLDTNVAKERCLEYKVFELVSIDGVTNLDVLDSFADLKRLGFDVVEHKEVTTQDYLDIDAEFFNPEIYDYPVDGTIYKYNSYEYGKSLGSTEHHPLNMLARKWKDDTYETVFRGIEWNTTRTGLINPTAIFDTVNIDGSDVSRATLHNLSYIEELALGEGDIIEIYKANMIIPKVHTNLTKSNTWTHPNTCPCCGGETEIHNDNGSKTLHCINPDCPAKLLSKLEHACSKNALNIDGMSEATLEFLYNKGWVKSLKDIYTISNKKEIYHEWINSSGFGKKSVDKLLSAIEKSKYTTFDRFLYAQSIPLIGRSASKDIANYCNGSFDDFANMIVEYKAKELLKIDGFGETMYNSLVSWFDSHWIEFLALKQEFNFQSEKKEVQGASLEGKTFVITGSLEFFKNRDELTEKILSLGGKVSGSVSAKTSYLINNDVNSTSGKNAKAKSLGIEIISEKDFLEIIGTN
jgi:DNA ligase (NAD+)